MQHPLPFTEWIEELKLNAALTGHARRVRRMGKHVLQFFWEEGCEPTIADIIDHSEGMNRIAA
jgi:hypothetical protein